MISIDGAFGLGYFPSYNHDGAYGRRSPLTVPLGVDWNMTSFASGHFAFGLLFQILDLGGYSQLRFTPDGSASAPRVLQALSPGLNVRLGLFRSPLTLNVGVAYDFDEGQPVGPSGHAPDGYHINVFLAVDTTLFVLKAY
jgi:hypothetical protein